ncbi:MAG: SAM-dependent chlorinase/fluorinase [Nitrospiraceae bacterium]|nr:SAM-dependent chlorinase/fluorinase [Nitrospiraceae bacterium]
MTPGAAASSPITLLTDFGLEDAYAGVMKGVVLGINPAARIVDITHAVRPGDIAGARFILANSVKFFPPGSVHAVVVDPGVGSGRRAIIVRSGGFHFVGPDNGVFTGFFPGAEKIISITNERFMLPRKKLKSPSADTTLPRGATFDGRDVFAPAAAWLSRGVRAEEFGPEIKDPVELPLPEPFFEKGQKGGLTGHVVHIDRFGNCITNIGLEQLLMLGKDRGLIRVKVKGLSIGLVGFYMSRRDGRPHALVNSDGLLEIFIPGGDAGRALGLKTGAAVKVF